jgi:hypothetical protein
MILDNPKAPSLKTLHKSIDFKLDPICWSFIFKIFKFSEDADNKYWDSESNSSFLRPLGAYNEIF